MMQPTPRIRKATAAARNLALACLAACLAACAFSTFAFADEEHGEYASARDYGSQKQVGVYGMTPISAADVAEGTYSVEARTSSSFFAFEDVQLEVRDGKMHARFTMASGSYTLVYPGSAEDAAAAPYDDYIEIDPDGDVFEMDVPALNQPFECAAYSKRKNMWYDRQVLIEASSLPEGALPYEVPDYDFVEDAIKAYGKPIPGTPEAIEAEKQKEVQREQAMADPAAANAAADGPDGVPIDLEDGTYSIEVNMTGGSGRASVSSPTWLVVRDGKAYARLLWSSSYYDYMVVEDTTYYNETTDGGNSTFTIPITTMDEPMGVIADTTAMGDPVEIEYQLTFYQDTVGSASQVPQEAAISVLKLSLAVIIVGGIANYLVKRHRKRAQGTKAARR
ncbi:hypothetical protein [Slackia heliotrinireducens]|uniref:hypothetical protein n=1 Tax=Slackia heliotrinireducens TaxID=84110 RepID=UPI003314A85E